MLVLRRGRSTPPGGSGLDTGLTDELGAGRGRRSGFLELWRPPSEVFECGDDLIVRIEIAGLAPEDLDVIVERDELLVRGERTAGNPGGPRLYHESRIRYGSFETGVRLPFPVNVGEASADYVDGLLTIRLPRRLAAKVSMRDDAHRKHARPGER